MAVISRLMFSFNWSYVCGRLANGLDFGKKNKNKSHKMLIQGGQALREIAGFRVHSLKNRSYCYTRRMACWNRIVHGRVLLTVVIRLAKSCWTFPHWRPDVTAVIIYVVFLEKVRTQNAKRRNHTVTFAECKCVLCNKLSGSEPETHSFVHKQHRVNENVLGPTQLNWTVIHDWRKRVKKMQFLYRNH